MRGVHRCWGNNDFGQLGDGSTTQSLTPVAVSGVTDATISAGGYHNCAVTSSDTVSCWGDNSIFQLGQPFTIDAITIP